MNIMFKMKKLLAFALATVMGCAMLTGCSSKEVSDLDYIKENGKIVMGLDDSFPPMGFRDEQGNIVGYDVDLAKEVAKRMDLELILQPIDWATKELELENKNIDVIWNGFSYTEERAAALTLSDPYMQNTQVVMVLEGSNIKTLSDLKGKKVAVQDGSSAQNALKADEDLYAAITPVDFKDNMTASLDVKNGNVDALAIDSVVAKYYMSKNPGFRLLDQTLAPEDYVIGFRKGDVKFQAEVDRILDEMEKDGTMKQIQANWFAE